MRLTPEQITIIKEATCELAGNDARAWLFGSRVDDQSKGGDVDLLVEVDGEVIEPALLSAKIATRVSLAMYGRKVDVIIKASNLKQLPIHTMALQEGVQL
jgi:predicted nucleotidyltransferase